MLKRNRRTVWQMHTNLFLLSLLLLFLRKWNQNRDETRAQSWQRCFVFSYRNCSPPRSPGSGRRREPPLGSSHRAEWHSTAGRHGSRSKHLHLSASSLTDTHNTCGWPPIYSSNLWLPPRDRPRSLLADPGNQTEWNQSYRESSLLHMSPAAEALLINPGLL